MNHIHIRKLSWLTWGIGLVACGQPPGGETSLDQGVVLNGGFESGALAPGWTLATNINPTLAAVPPASTAQLNLSAGGTNRTFVKTNAMGVQTPLTGLSAGVGVPTWPRSGNSSVVVNETGANQNVNSIVQSWVTDATDVDPSDGKVHIRFVLAPVLQNPGHSSSQQPYFFVALRNKTAPRVAEFFTEFNFANQPGVPWQSQASGSIQFTDWQLFDIAPDANQFVLGDTLEAQIYAAGCSPSAHWGEVFLDGFGSQSPGLTVSKTAPTSTNVNSDVTYSFVVANNSSGLVQNVIADEVLPSGLTFVSVSAPPSATCTTPAVGATGTVECNFGTMNPGATATFQVVAHVPASVTAGMVVTNGNYGVKGNTVSRTLGPKRSTTIAASSTFADLTISKTDGVAAVETGNPTTYTIVASNLGPSAVVGATVTDTLPAGLTGATWTCVGAGGGVCPASGSGNISASVDLPVGATATFTLTGTASTPGKLINTATIAAPAGVVDNFPSSNGQTDVNDVGTLSVVTVTKDPTGGGTGEVRTAPAGISCDGACASQSTSFLDGTSVTLTAVADPFSTFAGWSGACTGAGLTCTFTVSGPSAVVARFITCGNGILGPTEGCDDGNTTSGDGCDATCKVENSAACNATSPGLLGDASCASGICDGTAGAPGTCEAAGCGNGRLEAGEGCDDGGNASGDGCDATCLIENGSVCNTNVLGAVGDPGCASGVCDATAGAPGTCEAAGCGDGRIGPGEGCDDGGAAGGDGCSATCLIETGSVCNANPAGAVGDPGCETGICDTSGGAPGVCEVAGCGDGRVGIGEGCDDGNTAAGDGCNATCLSENGHPCGSVAVGLTDDASCESMICDMTGGAPGVCRALGCGNNRLEAGEGCDDGNNVGGDGCNTGCLLENGRACNTAAPGAVGDASCVSSVCDITGGAPGVCEMEGCGDGRLEVGEGCDDGNTVAGDGCNAVCLVETGKPCNAAAPGAIGDPSCEGGVCDASAGSPGTCTIAGCGNGRLEAGEGCDDHNTTNGDGCDATCKIEDGTACNTTVPGALGDLSCASGVCDTANGTPGRCLRAGCGDGRLNVGEGCDDHNTTNGDGCNSTCKIEDGKPCNAKVPGATGDESCAGGMCDNAGGTPGVCFSQRCGDGTVQKGEACDDGNATDGDGCDSKCTVEANWGCEQGNPSKCNKYKLAGGGFGCSATSGSSAGLLIVLLAFVLRKRRGAVVALAGAAVALFAPKNARAQLAEKQDFPVERFHLSSDRGGMFGVEGPFAGKEGSLDVGLWVGDADDPLVVYRDSGTDRVRTGALVRSRVGSELVVRYAIQNWLSVALGLPFVIYQDRDSMVEGVTGMLPSVGSGIGDLRLSPKLVVRQDPGFSVSIVPEFTFPTGQTEGYRGERTVSFSPTLVLGTVRGAVRAVANLGYMARRMSQSTVLGVDDELVARLGVGVRASESLELAVTGSFATAAGDPFKRDAATHLEFIGGPVVNLPSRWQLFGGMGVGAVDGYGTPDWRALIGLRVGALAGKEERLEAKVVAPLDGDRDGIIDSEDKCLSEPEDVDSFEDGDGCPDTDNDKDGILDPADKCPMQPETANGFEDSDGCPDAVADSDGDGITDDLDKCPQQAEDKDGFEDGDGCPDPDNDQDGVPDASDNCPNEPGTAKFQGCKDKQLVMIQDGKIELLDVVYFALDKDVILTKSYPLLDDVAKVIMSHPEISRIEVQGHTDSQGNDAYNMDLSQRRAEQVRAYLINKSVVADRLDAKGYGETQPIGDNATVKGRAANRRVVFKLVGDASGVRQQQSGPGVDTLEKERK